MNAKTALTGTPQSKEVKRYFFNVRNGGISPFPQCIDLSSIQEVRQEAVNLACLALGDNPEEFWRAGEWQLTVTNESGLNLFSLLILATDAPVARGH